MLHLRFFKTLQSTATRLGGFGLVVASGLLLALPADAHHPFGGATPINAVQGFLSGLGHPVIGVDHLAFVITAGLLAAAVGGGFIIPLGFVIASLVGTGIHLMELNLPAPEFFISASVLLFGVLLAMRQQPNRWIVAGLAALSGIFHGYAYGEAVVGADMAPIVAYLLGFAVIQAAISAAAYGVANRLIGKTSDALGLRFAGFTLAGVGAAFLSGVVLG